MNCIDITTIQRTCQRNIAGLRTIRILEASKIVNVSPVFEGVLSGTIKIQTGAEFVNWQPDMLSVFTEPRKTANGRDYYEPEVLISFSKDREQLIKHHHIMRGEKYALLVTDRNGVTKFLRKIQNLSTYTSGDFKGRNFYSFRFFNQMPTAAPIFLGNIDNS